jgi:hypothetical protein
MKTMKEVSCYGILHYVLLCLFWDSDVRRCGRLGDRASGGQIYTQRLATEKALENGQENLRMVGQVGSVTRFLTFLSKWEDMMEKIVGTIAVIAVVLIFAFVMRDEDAE